MTHPRTAPAPLAAVAGSLGLCLSAAVLAGAPALAAPTSTPAAGQARQQPVVVVMDHSGSMLNADADASGTTRVDAAKAATKDLIQAAPEGAELGLVTFGHRLGTDDFADGDVKFYRVPVPARYSPVLPGETHYYRVDAQAGQSLAARVDVRGDAETAESVTARLHNPLRELMALAHDGDPDAPPHRLFGTVHAREGQSMHASTLLPIDPRRRTQDVQDTDTGGSISVPGGQYVAVTRAYRDDAADEPLAFELTVDVTGQPQEAGGVVLTRRTGAERG